MNFVWNGAKIKPLIGVILIGLLLWFCPIPEGLDVKTWHLFSLFVATIVAIIVAPLPIGGIAISALALCTITNTLTIDQALGSFSSKIVWLILVAFLIARGFIKTGLGSRVAYFFISCLGSSTLGLSYGLIVTESILAPLTPSNTARGAGIIYPVISALTKEYNSKPGDKSRKKIGSYLLKMCYQVNIITSAMFLTGTAANPLIASLAAKSGVIITWTTWAWAAIVPGLINLIILPLAMFVIMPPEVKYTPKAPELARAKLKEQGPLSFGEIMMLVTFALLLTLWIAGSYIGISATTTALVGLSILLITGVLTLEDVLKEKGAWNTFLWLATLLMMASNLTEMGMMSWFGKKISVLVSSLDWVTTLIIISIFYFYTHYFFASITAHVTSLYTALLVVAVGSGAPLEVTAIFMAFLSSLCAGITHYGTGTAPVYFGAGYHTIREWWVAGGLMSIVNILTWGIVGSIWWKIIGLW